MLQGKKILLGITGSIAAYKVAFLVRALVKKGAEVQVIMTPSASSFITPLTLSTLSRRPVFTEIISEESWNNHVELGLWADLYLIAPTSANTLAKMANGSCDNMVTACYLSARCVVAIAPAMDVDMWQHPATRRNLNQLLADGVHLIPVEHGELASGLTGLGRMAEPEHIVEHLENHFKNQSVTLEGIKVLITAGPTYEDLDPVRFIGNRSSGKMGLALTRSLLDRGAEVHLIMGPNHLRIEAHPLLHLHLVQSAAQMASEAKQCWPRCQVAILAAAVADYTPAQKAQQKIKKSEGNLTVELTRTEDIATSLGATKKSNQITIGFALETEQEEAHAREKIIRKNFDFIVLNSLNDAGAGFQVDTNKITILHSNGDKVSFPLKSKTEVAEDIVDVLENQIIKKNQA
ncbi:MAG: bifunctional phosphopantothenoylcysteine decarboxylase/phosphopantothenate--cysteine ligase CoaBC [Saprospiraceae bacterium]|nr:bifunctional phosphopantothenoylcysteine decarboxylase/phosphopantothenate--cysteine ligase CoaBC [Saprospiraceae bacterium]